MQRFTIYRAQCIQLAKSLIIKSDTIAQQMNLAITENGGYVSDDRTTWRYYLHLAGKHHVVDKPVYLTSVDTNETIELTSDNLKVHKKTYNVYRSNQQYLDQLIIDNPDMAVYIKGVFYPVDVEWSVGVDDCTILYYTPSLVESQEQSLIYDLERLIRAAHVRYMAEGWRIHNDAFVLAFYDMLFPMLPAMIMRLRHEKQHTIETHSYFVTEFLASHQGLDEYMPYLTKKQTFILYRNIRYWERNSGKKEIFDWMVDTLLTGWDMPAVAYKVSQKIQDPVNDDSITPVPTAYQEALNFTETVSGRDLDLVTTTDVITKELSLARSNAVYESLYQTDLDTRLSLTQYPNLTTKLVEVTAIDPEAIERFEFTRNFFAEWLHLVANGQYNISHDFLNPTNGDTIKLTSKELLALYLYAGLKGYSGVSLEQIPEFVANGVQVKRWVGAEELRNYIAVDGWEGRYDSTINYYVDSQVDTSGAITSNDELYDLVYSLVYHKRYRYVYSYNRRRLNDRTAACQLFVYNYRDYKCPLHLPYTSYDQFFQTIGLRYDILSEETWQDIAIDALNIATNLENRSVLSQGEIQRAMVRLMTTLSSYTVHFASRMASDSYDVTDPIVPLLGDIALSGSGSMTIEEPLTDVVDVQTSQHMTTATPLVVDPNIEWLAVPQRFNFLMDIYMGIQVTIHQNHTIEINEPMTAVVSQDMSVTPAKLTRLIVKNKLDGFKPGEFFSS